MPAESNSARHARCLGQARISLALAETTDAPGVRACLRRDPHLMCGPGRLRGRRVRARIHARRPVFQLHPNSSFAVRYLRGQWSPLLRSFPAVPRKAAQQVLCPGGVPGLDSRSTSIFVGSVSGGLASSSTLPSGRSVLSLNSCFSVSCELPCVVLILTPTKLPQAAVALVGLPANEQPKRVRNTHVTFRLYSSAVEAVGVAINARLTRHSVQNEASERA